MESPIFDTHALIRRLTAGGMPEQQEEILAEEKARMLGEQLATKHDVALLRADMDRLKDQLTIRLSAMLAGGIAIVAALVKLL
jgi:hypothetical protein